MQKHKIFLSALALFVFLFLLPSCIYEPEAFEAVTKNESTTSRAEFGTVYPVNPGKQICNPSISNDTLHYPASLLWLNFSGTLSLKDAPKGYNLSQVLQHDRLTISDTAGKVLWYVKHDSMGVQCQFQDPEWSTHPDFIVALAGFDSKNSNSCNNIDYGIMAIHLQSKKSIWLASKKIIEEAFPHLWIHPEADLRLDSLDSAPTFQDSVQRFFKNTQVKLSYVTEDQKIAYVDYSKDTVTRYLQKPTNRHSWFVNSPLISPDGLWITYNLMSNSYTWENYIQEISPHSEAILVPFEAPMLSHGAEPHWWQFRDKLYLLWAEFPSGSTMLNKADFMNPSIYDASVGRTAMREVQLLAGNLPLDMAVQWGSEIKELAKIPMTGGRSPDGRFLATGTNNGYLLQLP